jgi:hypothetical protein
MTVNIHIPSATLLMWCQKWSYPFSMSKGLFALLYCSFAHFSYDEETANATFAQKVSNERTIARSLIRRSRATKVLMCLIVVMNRIWIICRKAHDM